MSNELKSTPGPWEISWNTFRSQEAHGVYANGEMDLKGYQIAIVNYWPTLDKNANEETGKANVQLIAAAPELYNALKEIIEDQSLHGLYPNATKALLKANPAYKP